MKTESLFGFVESCRDVYPVMVVVEIFPFGSAGARSPWSTHCNTRTVRDWHLLRHTDVIGTRSDGGCWYWI